jgi:hypothetical protein
VKADNDNARAAFKAFDALPLFATDRELAVAIVGPARASEWLKNSFPFHKGRAVPLVKLFYDHFIGITSAQQLLASVPREREKANLEIWTKSQRRASNG